MVIKAINRKRLYFPYFIFFKVLHIFLLKFMCKSATHATVFKEDRSADNDVILKIYPKMHTVGVKEPNQLTKPPNKQKAKKKKILI